MEFFIKIEEDYEKIQGREDFFFFFYNVLCSFLQVKPTGSIEQLSGNNNFHCYFSGL